MQYQVSSQEEKVKGFTDLVAWQKAHKLVLCIYKITKAFPVDERRGLSDQIRRAGVSITSNIAEGFSRATSADKSHFYDVSLGSLTELQNQLLLSRDLGYIDAETFANLAEQSITVHKLIFGLSKAVRAGKGVRPKA